MIELWNNSVTLRLMVILVPLLSVAFWCLWFLTKSHNNLVDTYPEVKQKLLDANTEEAFNEAIEDAIEWSRLTWHHSHNTLNSELKGIIEAKLNMFK